MASQEHNSSDGSPPVTPITIHSVVGIMPRPGRPDALSFDGTNVSELFKDWEAECEEYGLSEAQKCGKLSKYYTKGIKDAVEKLVDREFGKDWSLLKKELKRLYWQKDRLRNSPEELEQLMEVAKPGKVSVEIYVFKYRKISESLVKKHAISSFEKNTRLLRGLLEDVRSKVLDHGSEKGWRMFVNDVDIEEPVWGGEMSKSQRVDKGL